MTHSFCSFVIVSVLLCCCSAELYIATLPKGTQLSNGVSTINSNEVSHLLTHLMGLQSDSESQWSGVSSIDLFNRPAANLFISISVPEGAKFTLKKYNIQYKVEGINPLDMSFLEKPHLALTQLYKDQKPVILFFERDGKFFNTACLNALMFDDTAQTLDVVKARFMGQSSILDKVPADSCLTVSQDSDASFLGELQTMADVLSKLQNNRNVVEDAAPDSYIFSINLESLALRYGVDSCQVKAAVQLLEKFIPSFIEQFNQLYNNRLLSEVSVAAPIGYSFHDVAIRHTRSLQAVEPNDTVDNTTIHNVKEFVPIDYAVTVNLTFWVTVVFALAVLATSYGIWFMDPGWDSVIYRMTTQRMKFD